MLWHQLRSPLLALLLAAAVASYFAGERSDAVIIGVIVGLSAGLGFVSEYRAEKAAEALHSQIRHQAVIIRDGRPVTIDVTALVPAISPGCSSATSCPLTSGCWRPPAWNARSRSSPASRCPPRRTPRRCPRGRRWPSCPGAR